MKTCGEALVELLEAYGIDTVFGIPGVHTIELYRGLGNASLRHVTPRHEQGAGFMADGYARACGKPAACFIITGPGMTNIATAMGQALQDSIPMLVISSVNQTHRLAMGEGRLHELPDQRALVAGVCRFSHTLLRGADLPKVLARAFGVFTSARPGPVHIEIPIDVITQPAGDMDLEPWPLPSPPGADPAVVSEAAKLLSSAKRPLIVVGGGAVNAAAGLRALAEKLSAPVLNTVNGKGILPYGHPLSVGGSGSSSVLRAELDATDVLLAAGTELSETDFDFFLIGDVKPASKIIRMDIDPAQMSRNAKPAIALCCDARIGLEALSGAVTKRKQDGPQRAAELRDGLKAQRDERYDAVFAAIREVLPEVVIAGDSAQPTYYALLHYECDAPRHYFHSVSGYGTLGYAIPAAIGAKIAKPDLPVIGLIGDGAAQFTIGELASAVDEGINVTFLIWNNHGYSEIRQFMDEAGTERVGVDISAPDFVGVAESFGCAGCRITTIDQLKAALGEANARPGPSVIEIMEKEIAGGSPNFTLEAN
jgi:acetolactate synthase-1/2/3 large subunit